MNLFGKVEDFTKEVKSPENSITVTIEINCVLDDNSIQEYDIPKKDLGDILNQIRLINTGSDNQITITQDDDMVIIGPSIIRNSIITITE